MANLDGQRLLAELGSRMKNVRGRLTSDTAMDKITWFRVGGPAELMFVPADEADLAEFLKNLPLDVPVLTVGIGSNLLVRDGGIPGVVIRLSAKGFGTAEQAGETSIRAGAALPDKRLAASALNAGLGGFHFYHGIPGSLGGALRMNAGANGVETRERVVEVRAVDRKGEVHVLSNGEMGYGYRHSSADGDLIFTSALLEGYPAEPSQIRAKMDEVQGAPRDGPADPREDRRLDLQESGRLFGLEGDRQGRLSRPCGRRRTDVGASLQLHDQHRQRHRLRPRRPRRDGPRSCVRDERHFSSLGDQAPRPLRAGPRGEGVGAARRRLIDGQPASLSAGSLCVSAVKKPSALPRRCRRATVKRLLRRRHRSRSILTNFLLSPR